MSVLAAGLGSRMGGCAKPAIAVGGATVLERLTTAFRSAGCEQVSVVLGPYRDAMLALADRCQARPVVHTLPEPTLADSQRLAIDDHVSAHAGSDLMLVVGDLPLLATPHVRALRAAWQGRPAHIDALIPTVEGVPGHPVMLSWRAVCAIHALPSPLSVRDWMAADTARLWRWPGADAAYVTDIDTPQDLERARAALAPSGHARTATAFAWRVNQ
ncbi:NTP transferase domain-containing protein [Acidovorax sp. FG27]|uniref:nucleotidyltransferase family protein n=1 Tax=Acidovorax sp. FG27 TaxID=3133652 RepID=UPI0030EAF30C